MRSMNINLDYAQYYQSGHQACVAMNREGLIVEAHRGLNDNNLYTTFRVLEGGTWTDQGTTVTYGGSAPSVALNDSRTFLWMYEKPGEETLTYAYGTLVPKLKADNKTVEWTINWHAGADCDPGTQPCITLNNSGLSVEVHLANKSTEVWYRVVRVIDGNINLFVKLPTKLAVGVSAKVAINNNGAVVVAYTSGSAGDIYYHVGQHDGGGRQPYEDGAIVGGFEQAKLSGLKGFCTSLALTDDGIVTIALEGMIVTGKLEGGTIDWRDKALVYRNPGHYSIAVSGRDVVAVSSSDGHLFYTASTLQDRAAWMSDNLALLGDRQLKDIAMPATHDSGMHTCQKCLQVDGFGANALNTVTQRLSIFEQLVRGARYFDIRPVLDSDGILYTGHFDTGTSLGCEGPELGDVLNDVAKFLNEHREVVILKISHTYVRQYIHSSTDIIAILQKKMDKLHPEKFNRDQMGFVCDHIRSTLGEYLVPNLGGQLHNKTLNEILAQGRNGKGVVLPVIQDLDDGLHANGLWRYRDFDQKPCGEDIVVFDQFADNEKPDAMASDQWNKLGNKSNHGDNLFMLSWTLSQSTAQIISCATAGLSGFGNADFWKKLPGAVVGAIGDFFSGGHKSQNELAQELRKDYIPISQLADQANLLLWGAVVAKYKAGKIHWGMLPGLINQDLFTGIGTDIAMWINRRLHVGSTLKRGEYLMPGDRVYADDRAAWLTYQQDGNLVLYRDNGGDGEPRWQSDTVGRPAWRVYLEQGGNLAIYGAPGLKIKDYGAKRDSDLNVVGDSGGEPRFTIGGRTFWFGNADGDPHGR